MGFDLRNKDGEDFRHNSRSWGLTTRLALEYGWTPEGTTLQDGDGAIQADWEGGYWSNDGQEVSATDANNMAKALQRALDDPNFDQRAKAVFAEVFDAWRELGLGGQQMPDNWIANVRKRMEQFIQFCKSAFIIY